jgi:uncharacterized protein YndB with AHSA1/START domain
VSTIDVVVETEIAAAPADVAAVMFDPAREPEWMAAVKTVEVVDPALRPGARVRRTASFFGKEIAWTTAVEAVHFPHVLTLRIADGPFTGTVSYQIQRSAGGSVVRIRNIGETTALGLLPSALIEAPMRSTLAADLERLKSLVVEKSAP